MPKILQTRVSVSSQTPFLRTGLIELLPRSLSLILSRFIAQLQTITCSVCSVRHRRVRENPIVARHDPAQIGNQTHIVTIGDKLDADTTITDIQAKQVILEKVGQQRILKLNPRPWLK